MRKYSFSVVLSLVVGVLLGKFMIDQYNIDTTQTVFNDSDYVYFLKQGEYANMDEMKSNTSSLAYYTYVLRDNKYIVYVGITKSMNNGNKIKSYYEKYGYNISMEKEIIDNSEFLSVLSQYDLLLDNASDDIIESICGQVMSSYEEVIGSES